MATTATRPEPSVIGETSWGSEISLYENDVEHSIAWFRLTGEECVVAIQHFNGRQEVDFTIFNKQEGLRRQVTFSYEELDIIRDFLTLNSVDAILKQQ